MRGDSGIRATMVYIVILICLFRAQYLHLNVCNITEDIIFRRMNVFNLTFTCQKILNSCKSECRLEDNNC